MSLALRGVWGAQPCQETRQLSRPCGEVLANPQLSVLSAVLAPALGAVTLAVSLSVPWLLDTADLREIGCSPGRLLVGQLPSLRCHQGLRGEQGPRPGKCQWLCLQWRPDVVLPQEQPRPPWGSP